jgi:hypothetical protein
MLLEESRVGRSSWTLSWIVSFGNACGVFGKLDFNLTIN